MRSKLLMKIMVSLMILFTLQSVQAITVFSNLPQQGGTSGYCLNLGDVAVGFTIPAGESYLVNSITIGVDWVSNASITLEIYDDAGGMPGSNIASLGTQTITADGTYSYLSGTAVLVGGTTYWAVASTSASGCSVGWDDESEGIPTGIFTLVGYLRNTGSWVDASSFGPSGAISIDANVVSAGTTIDNPCPVFFDGRINNCDTGNWIVIYGHDYGDGQGLLITDTEGVNLLQVTASQIAAVPKCPDVNTLIASGNDVALYRLAGSCDYQVNSPAADGKTYVVIFDELYADAGYTSHEE